MSEIDLSNIHHMDCVEGMKGMPEGSVDLVVTDLAFAIHSGASGPTATGRNRLE